MSNLPTFFIHPPISLLTIHPHLHELAQQLSQYYHAHTVNLADLQKLGLALWQVLDIDIPLTKHALMMEYHGNAVDSLPWECLYHPDLGFLGKHPDYTLSRYVQGNGKTIQPPTGPLNILLITAQPSISQKLAFLDLETEQQTVHNALTPFINAGWVRFYAPDDGRFSTFVELLQNQLWHLVILSGHGIFQKQANSAPLAGFVFEGEGEQDELITAHTLAQVFQATNVQCVVLAACQSAQLSVEEDFPIWQRQGKGDLVTSIIQAGVRHVIGMREPLIDRAGSLFVQTLCIALAQQARIDVAVQQARIAMTQLLAPNEVWHDIQGQHLVNDPNIGQWCLPVLFSDAPSQTLVDWHFCPQSSPPNPLINQFVLPKIFIGRRRELRTLGEALRQGTIRRLLIRGAGGLGKTALLGKLAISLAQQGYRILVYQGVEKVGENLQLEELTQGRWILCLDSLERFQNPQTLALTDDSIQTNLEILSQWNPVDLRILVTSRWTIPVQIATYFSDYRLVQPNFADFSRYLQHLGLPYPYPQQWQIYQILAGNFQGVKLLQSMPFCLEAKNLMKQLAIVRRYLQAYLRNHQ